MENNEQTAAQEAQNPVQTEPTTVANQNVGSNDADFYKAELERVQKEREAEKLEYDRYRREQSRALKVVKQELKEKKVEVQPQSQQVLPSNDEETVEIDGELYYKKDIERSRKILGPVVSEEIERLKSELFSNRLAEEVKQTTSNPSEQKLIEYHLQNSIVPTGDVKKDIARARLLANEGLLLKSVNSEAAEEARSRALAAMSSAGGIAANPSSSNAKRVDSTIAEAAELLKDVFPDVAKKLLT